MQWTEEILMLPPIVEELRSESVIYHILHQSSLHSPQLLFYSHSFLGSVIPSFLKNFRASQIYSPPTSGSLRV